MSRLSVSRLSVSLLVFAVLASCAHRAQDVEAPGPSAERGTVLVFSDLHFDPFADPALVARLHESAVEAWPRILATAPPSPRLTHGDNTSHSLLLSSLDTMSQVAPDPDFILITGDFLVHDFEERFVEALGEHAPGLDTFLEKTMAFLAEEVRQRWPRTPVLPVIGNNDSLCGNYKIEPRGEFLKWLEGVWSPLLTDPEARRSFASSFAEGGHYALDLPGVPQRLIVLNTVFLSRLYENSCGDATSDPLEETFIFLEAELTKARRDRRDIWLIFHIPPGIDAYQTLRVARKHPAPDGKIHPVFFWREDANRRFVDLVTAHGQMISAAIGAHIHRDSFQLLGYDAKTVSARAFVRLAPAISPVYRNNPGFQIFQYDRRSSALLDYEVFNLDLDQPHEGWNRRYRFSEAYAHQAIDAVSLSKIYHAMLRSPEVGDLFLRHHALGETRSEITADSWPVYWTTIGHLDASSFARGLETSAAELPP